MPLQRIRVKAFTLLECLVALLVIASSLLVFEGLSRNLAPEMTYQATHPAKDWLVFTEQFRQELDQSRLVRTDHNRVYVTKKGQELAFGLSQKGDFRKTNWSGQGYQPMLMGLKSVRTSETNGQLNWVFAFESGLEREFVYVFQENR